MEHLGQFYIISQMAQNSLKIYYFYKHFNKKDFFFCLHRKDCYYYSTF